MIKRPDWSYIERLLGKSVAVIGFGYLGSRLYQLLRSYRDTLDIQVKVLNRQNIAEIASTRFDYVFNCAGNTGDFRNQPIETVESNIELTSYILKTCDIREALVCLSSTRIYGFSSDPAKIFFETDSTIQDHLSLEAIYDNSKRMMECLLINTPRRYRKVIVRLSNVFGDFRLVDLDDSTFLKLMLRYRYQNEKLEVRQSVESRKDYVFIDDALDGILRSGIVGETDDIYNICSGQSYSVKDWATFLQLNIDPVSIEEAAYSMVSNEKAKSKVGFVNRNRLEDLSIADIFSV